MASLCVVPCLCVSHLWKGKVACHSSKQQMLPSIKPSASAITHHSVPGGEFRMQKSRKYSVLWILAQASYDAYLRNNFSELRLLHLPIQRKALKSLLWDVCFLGLAVIFWCLTTWFSFLFVCFFQQKFLYILSVSSLTSELSTSELSERLPPGL